MTLSFPSYTQRISVVWTVGSGKFVKWWMTKMKLFLELKSSRMWSTCGACLMHNHLPMFRSREKQQNSCNIWVLIRIPLSSETTSCSAKVTIIVEYSDNFVTPAGILVDIQIFLEYFSVVRLSNIKAIILWYTISDTVLYNAQACSLILQMMMGKSDFTVDLNKPIVFQVWY